jgi:hypothetical protein
MAVVRIQMAREVVRGPGMIRYSPAGWDTQPSPERPGCESRWQNLCSPNVVCDMHFGPANIVLAAVA